MFIVAAQSIIMNTPKPSATRMCCARSPASRTIHRHTTMLTGKTAGFIFDLTIQPRPENGVDG
jgi:hypothetical protein